jgi:hypothetical protein
MIPGRAREHMMQVLTISAIHRLTDKVTCCSAFWAFKKTL